MSLDTHRLFWSCPKCGRVWHAIPGTTDHTAMRRSEDMAEDPEYWHWTTPVKPLVWNDPKQHKVKCVYPDNAPQLVIGDRLEAIRTTYTIGGDDAVGALARSWVTS